MLGVGLLLTIGTGLFVASEFALVNLDRADLEARQAAGETRLSLTISALKITSTHLSSAQLGITLTTLLTGYTMEPAISNLLRPVLSGWGVPDGVVTVTAATIAIVFATVMSMILGELVPKNFALAVPRQTAKLVMPFQVAFTTVFRPAITVLNGSANGVLRAMGIEGVSGCPHDTESLVDLSCTPASLRDGGRVQRVGDIERGRERERVWHDAWT